MRSNDSHLEDKNSKKLQENKEKSDAYTSNQASGLRGTTKSDITNHTDNARLTAKQMSLKSQDHMNDYLKIEEFKAKNPLEYRFR